jgi:TfoX/Sxy family transcriptional regulator of competence genes
MATKQASVDFLLEQMAAAGDVSARKMFGEYAIYLGPKVVALVCDDQLFVKPTAAGKAAVGKPREAPPYPGAKPYYLISGDRCEDSDFLSDLIVRTAAELPAPAAKKAKSKSPKAKAKKKTAPEKKPPKRKPSPKQKPSPKRGSRGSRSQ